MSGGGGYGDPLDRDSERVLEDVLDEKVSLHEARCAYGVVIDASTVLRVDDPATQALRAELRAASTAAAAPAAGGTAKHPEQSQAAPP